MTTSEDLQQAWDALKREVSPLPGVYQRRVFAHTGFALFAGLARPSMATRLTLGVPSAVGTEDLERATRGFRVIRHYESADRTTYVSLELDTPAYHDLFGVITEDVATSILAAADEAGAVAAMRDRLNRWERFMTAAGPEGLSREDQIGLFGELTFIRTLLGLSIKAEDAVGWWTRANQDFQNGNRVVEVKATTGNSPTILTISNELQLDDADCEELFLFHLWLKEMRGGGVSLPTLVKTIIDTLTGAAAATFEDRLLDAGYHVAHEGLYEAIGYTERKRNYYRVEEDFPRLGHSDLRPGVGKVKYTIDVAGFERFRRDELAVIHALAQTS